MAAEQSELRPPEEFPFPFEPYAIQKDFMRELYLTLERGHVGIFESPTGTVRKMGKLEGVRIIIDVSSGKIPEHHMWCSEVAH
jgi:chromosome transmission fidelity protein 1